MPASTDKYRKLYAVVARIPRGRVATYGQIAGLAGMPRHARLVGYALRILPAEASVPWFRVVNAAGRISARANTLDHESLQEQLLLREGVRIDGGAIDIDRYGWQPRAAGKRRRASREKTR